MQRNVATKQEPESPGVIDTIAEGFSIALVQPLLMLIPLLLDLYYWAGWRITVSGLTDPLRDWLLARDSSDVDEIAESVQRAGDSDVTRMFSLLVPSLLSDIERSRVYSGAERSDVVSSSWLLGLIVLAAAVAGSALLLMLYSVPLADTALNRQRSARARARAIALASVRILGFVALLAGAVLLLLGPLLVGGFALIAVGVNAGPLLASIALMFGFVAYLLTWFVPDAIIVSQVGPLRAIYLSIAVVRGSFWQTIGLTSASMVISLGLGEIWRQLVDTAPGLLLAAIANAFVASSLALASILFYTSRIRLLRPEFAP